MVEPVSIRLMKSGTGRVTAKPWAWSSWVDVLRREAMDRTLQQRRRILLQQYNDLGVRDWRLRPSETKQIRQIIRIDPGMLPTPPPPGWERQIVHSWRPWHYEPDITHIKAEARPTSTGVTREAVGWWEGASRGLPMAAALLAAFLLLLRVADRCLNTNILNIPRSRRQSEEWPTPNVMATNLAVRMTSDFNSIRPPSPLATQSSEQDLPPPYSECASGDASDPTVTSSRPKTVHDEPPPPYSACYVTYSNPKDGTPTVHFLTQQCRNLFANYEAGPSSVNDTGQRDEEPQEGSSLNQGDTRVVEGEGMSDNIQIDVPDTRVVLSENADNDSEVDLKEVTSYSQDRPLVV